jgi:hypothetical protein
MNDETGAVAVALADLRGAVNEGFAKLNGRLDTSLQRTATVEREVVELKAKFAVLEAKLWKLSLAAAAVGSAGGAGVFQLIQ